MTTEINNLCDKTKQLIQLSEETFDLEARERAAREQFLLAAAEGPIGDGAAGRKVSEARSMLDTIEARRAHLKKRMAPALEQLRQALRDADDTWTAIVRARARDISEKWVTVNARFYSGGKEGARDALMGANIPGVHDLHLFTWPGETSITEQSAIAVVSHFVRHLKKHAGNFNLDVSTFK
ncbi:MAG TPA: hypothetical protein VGO59_17985 [Verrucomicrobiae bacterium]|jgi:hypothetical protein